MRERLGQHGQIDTLVSKRKKHMKQKIIWFGRDVWWYRHGLADTLHTLLAGHRQAAARGVL